MQIMAWTICIVFFFYSRVNRLFQNSSLTHKNFKSILDCSTSTTEAIIIDVFFVNPPFSGYDLSKKSVSWNTSSPTNMA